MSLHRLEPVNAAVDGSIAAANSGPVPGSEAGSSGFGDGSGSVGHRGGGGGGGEEDAVDEQFVGGEEVGWRERGVSDHPELEIGRV
ncbi:hypothetical protein LOK49_LG09G00209 [Camellia lanceoleosa]|uniref:Uncharacterized protein n=1 Tax=Camellia lanceoleosa TaxID=1840588 RepID=A0ACC0GL11_9ERIC|nr:hypothetical protein LOK49_LG09G00209 [Camellia lanceoleosa]